MLLERFGPPPKVIWLRCGTPESASEEGGEHLIEITEPFDVHGS
jgi:predicted nuclease of predicted toxin-antitoxin system